MKVKIFILIIYFKLLSLFFLFYIEFSFLLPFFFDSREIVSRMFFNVHFSFFRIKN